MYLDFKSINEARKQGLARYNKRGLQKFYYTYKNISSLSGLSVRTLHKYNSIGKLNIKDIGSIVKFLSSRSE